MKNWILYLLALILTFLASLIIFGFIFETKAPPDHKPSITIEGKDISQHQIAYELMDKRLKSFKSHTVEKRLRIMNYKIFYVDIQKQINSGFIFTVSYSVKPSILESDWNAGSGAYNDKSRWIESKYLFVRVRQKGNTFIYDQGNTGGFDDKVILTPIQVIEEHFRWRNERNESRLQETITERHRLDNWNFNNLEYIKIIDISLEQRNMWMKRREEWAQRDGIDAENTAIFLVEFEVKFKDDLMSNYPSGKYKWHYYLVRKDWASPWLIDNWAAY